MKTDRLRHALPGILIAVLAVIPFAAARADQGAKNPPTAQELEKDSQALAKKLETYSADRRDDVIRSVKSTLRKLDARIDELSKQLADNWDKMSAEGRKQARKNLDALRAQRSHLDKWYQQLKGSSSDAWDNIRKGLSKAFRNLSRSLEQGDDSPDHGKGRNKTEPPLRKQSI